MKIKHDTRLKLGDLVRIAEITGFSRVMVRSVVAGRRNNPKIKKAIEAYVESMEELSIRFSE